MSASKEALEKLHTVLAKTLLEAVTEGTVEVDKEGNVHKVAAPAAILNVARQFLKDNNVEGRDTPGTPLGNLKEGMKLPFEGSPESYN